VERFNLRKLSELKVRKQYQIEITFAALENLNDSKDINSAWENIRENFKSSAKEFPGLYKLKQHEPWCDDECSPFLEKRKQAKKQWLQDNLNNVRHEASRHFRNKHNEYLKAKID